MTPSSHSMSRPELRMFLQEWFCGCGNPEEAAATLLALLEMHPLYDHRDQADAAFNDAGLEMLVLYTLDHFGLTEHGGSVGGAWLTDKGKAVRDALRAEKADHFEALMGDACVHGYDFSDPDHDCMAPEWKDR